MIEINKTNTIVGKAWGEEVVIVNNDMYCGKLLRFKPNAEFSFHFHMEKTETFYVNKGTFTLEYYDLEIGHLYKTGISMGDVIHIPKGNPHKLTCHSSGGGEIFEVSTPHKDKDSHRIGKGNSQK